MDYCLTKETGILKNTAEVPHRLSSITRAGFFSLTVGFLCLFCCFRLPFLCWNLHEGHNIKILKKKTQNETNYPKLFGKLTVAHCSGMSAPSSRLDRTTLQYACWSYSLALWLAFGCSGPESPLQVRATWRQTARLRSAQALGSGSSAGAHWHGTSQCSAAVRTCSRQQFNLPPGQWGLDFRRKVIFSIIFVVSLRRKFYRVVSKSLKTSYFDISSSSILTNNARWGIFEGNKKIPWNFAGTCHSCLCGVQTGGNLQVHCSPLCYWDVKFK